MVIVKNQTMKCTNRANVLYRNEYKVTTTITFPSHPSEAWFVFFSSYFFVLKTWQIWPKPCADFDFEIVFENSLKLFYMFVLKLLHAFTFKVLIFRWTIEHVARHYVTPSPTLSLKSSPTWVALESETWVVWDNDAGVKMSTKRKSVCKQYMFALHL